MKINFVIADTDSLYLKQITNYLTKSFQQFEVYSFSKKESLCDFMANAESQIDILIISEDIRCSETDDCAASTKIILSEDELKIEGYEVLQKYRKTSALLSEVMMTYGKVSDYADRMSRGTKKTKMIGVYSPVGGSGKTALALLTAHSLSDKKSFYLNLEKLNSTKGILPSGAQINLTELLVAIHGKERGIGLKLISGMYTAPKLGFSYVEPADSSLELNEISLDEQIRLLDEIKNIGQFNALVVDFDSELTADKIRLLDMCDRILVPFLPDLMSISKLRQMFEEMKLHPDLHSTKDKMVFIGNKMYPEAERIVQKSSLQDYCAPVAMLPISEQMANIVFSMESEKADGLLPHELLEELLK